jgi:hypothetical protein
MDRTLDRLRRDYPFSILTASKISIISPGVGTLSSAYLLALGRMRDIFFQFRKISFISNNSLTHLTPNDTGGLFSFWEKV